VYQTVRTESFLFRQKQFDSGTNGTEQLTTLPFHHRDPFDRLITAQALAEGLPVVSVDSQFDAYGVKRVW
jgi:PIN domain nuclease of toxin-antitoxin system